MSVSIMATSHVKTKEDATPAVLYNYIKHIPDSRQRAA
jgi:hypothetical protein